MTGEPVAETITVAGESPVVDVQNASLGVSAYSINGWIESEPI